MWIKASFSYGQPPPLWLSQRPWHPWLNSALTLFNSNNVTADLLQCRGPLVSSRRLSMTMKNRLPLPPKLRLTWERIAKFYSCSTLLNNIYCQCSTMTLMRQEADAGYNQWAKSGPIYTGVNSLTLMEFSKLPSVSLRTESSLFYFFVTSCSLVGTSKHGLSGNGNWILSAGTFLFVTPMQALIYVHLQKSQAPVSVMWLQK